MRPKLILIHDCFNPIPIDIKLGFKNSYESNQQFNFGYNVISIDSLREFFKIYQANLEISECHMQTELFKDPKNPMHNYHVDFNGERVLTNGTGLVFRQYNVIAQLNSI